MELTEEITSESISNLAMQVGPLKTRVSLLGYLVGTACCGVVYIMASITSTTSFWAIESPVIFL